PDNPTNEPEARNGQAAALALGQQLLVLRAKSDREVDVAFATMVEHQAGALLVSSDRMIAAMKRREFITVIGGAGARPRRARGRQTAVTASSLRAAAPMA